MFHVIRGRFPGTPMPWALGFGQVEKGAGLWKVVPWGAGRNSGHGLHDNVPSTTWYSLIIDTSGLIYHAYIGRWNRKA